MKGYKHVTRDLRCQIYALIASGISYRKIAQQLGVNVSTISREIKRNAGLRGYRPEQADKLAQSRRSEINHKPKKLTPIVCELIISRLMLGWSPQQISGRLKKDGIFSISHEAIYKFIWADKKAGGTLYEYLRHKKKPYNRRGSKNSGRGFIPHRVDIDKRPKVVETKTRKGDWEADTIIGADHKGAIVSLVDRASKYTILQKVEDKTAHVVCGVIQFRLKNIQCKSHTITFDNGKEFSKHVEIAKALGLKCFFAKPYHSWERGLNEHTNGLVREFIPKKTDFRQLSHEDIAAVEFLLNNRPRKILNYKTPQEVFFGSTRKL